MHWVNTGKEMGDLNAIDKELVGGPWTWALTLAYSTFRLWVYFWWLLNVSFPTLDGQGQSVPLYRHIYMCVWRDWVVIIYQYTPPKLGCKNLTIPEWTKNYIIIATTELTVILNCFLWNGVTPSLFQFIILQGISHPFYIQKGSV